MDRQIVKNKPSPKFDHLKDTILVKDNANAEMRASDKSRSTKNKGQSWLLRALFSNVYNVLVLKAFFTDH